MSKMICIADYKGYKIGDTIDKMDYNYYLEALSTKLCEDSYYYSIDLRIGLNREGKDIINDFCGIEIHPYMEDLLFSEYNNMVNSFISLADWREKQIDSVLQDDFSSLFTN